MVKGDVTVHIRVVGDEDHEVLSCSRRNEGHILNGGRAVAAILDISGTVVIAGAGSGKAVTDIGCAGERSPCNKIDVDTATACGGLADVECHGAGRSGLDDEPFRVRPRGKTSVARTGLSGGVCVVREGHITTERGCAGTVIPLGIGIGTGQ